MSEDDSIVERVEREFALRLLESIPHNDSMWEETEIAKLLSLLLNTLGLSDIPYKLFSFLEETERASPIVVAQLLDLGIQLSSLQIAALITSQSRTVDAMVATIDESLEQGLFNLKDPTAIEVLYSLSENRMDQEELLRYTVAICGHAKSKKIAGLILRVFTTHLSFVDAAFFIKRVISCDFFGDLAGPMRKFFAQIPDISHSLKELMAAEGDVNSEGEIVYSDEDENGNLREFIASEDEDEDEEEDPNLDDEEDGLLDTSAEVDRGGETFRDGGYEEEEFDSEDEGNDEDNLDDTVDSSINASHHMLNRKRAIETDHKADMRRRRLVIDEDEDADEEEQDLVDIRALEDNDGSDDSNDDNEDKDVVEDDDDDFF